jgi:hypothetical protein
LKKRESEALDRINDKQRLLEQNAYEHRQKLLKDLEIMRLRDEDFNQRNELHKKEINMEYDKIKQLKCDSEKKGEELINEKNNLKKN